ncbi:MAG TPA: right-handed parallel beta-helix repeat-containing protein [Kofleriaceae bacterium]|nr:right-handed parallel beta-helix repeat-containing protein [Kofleriaceae bacterium]
MQGKSWFVIVSILVVASACREVNPEYCAAKMAANEVDPDCPQGGEKCSSSDECGAPTPVCNLEKMACVQCLQETDCTGVRPVCDQARNVCVECQRHDQCASELCLDNGSCADPADVAYVSDNGSNSQMCSKDMPCQNLGQALSVMRKFIKVTGTINAAASINGDMLALKTFSIYGEPGMSSLTRPDNGTVLKIEKGVNIALFDLSIAGSPTKGVGLEIKDSNTVVSTTRVSVQGNKGTGAGEGLGVLLTAGSLTMNDSSVSDNVAIGVLVMAGSFESNRSSIYKNQGTAGVQTSGSFTMRDSKVYQNQIGVNVLGGTTTFDHSWIYENTGSAGVISAAGSMVTIGSSVIAGNTGTRGGLDIDGIFSISNNIISANGNPATTLSGVRLGSSTGTFQFNTVADNATTGLDLGIACSAPFAISNNILTGNTANGCAVTYSLTDAPVLSGMGNKTGDPMFIKLTDPLDPTFYRILSGSAAKDSADPAATSTVMKDIDGQARSDGKPDMGADEYN